MSHFQTPNSSLSPKRLREIVEILEDASALHDTKRDLMRELYKTIVMSPSGTEIRNRLSNWYKIVQLPLIDIVSYVETHVIPTPSGKYSDFAKKRRQTPRRRYTLKRRLVSD